MVDNINTNSQDSDNVNELLRSAGQEVNEVMRMMRAQRDEFRRRGMNVPEGSMESLRSLKKHIDTLTKNILNSQQELVSLRALAQTAALINSEQNTDDVLDQVMDTVIALTGAERGYIVLKNAETGELEFTVARGMDQSTLDNSKGGMIVSKSIVNRVADTGEPLLADNASQDEQFQNQASIVGFQLRSILAVPLKVREKVIGVVYCDNRIMSGLFKQHDLDVLNAFAHQSAVAIENAQLFESVRQRLAEITRLRDRMDNLFKSISSGVLTTDVRGTVLVANLVASEIIGSADLIGKRLFDILPDMSQEFQDAVNAALGQKQERMVECEPVINGSPRIWMMITSPLVGHAGSTHGVTLVIDDLTEQRHREKELGEARRYLPPALLDSMQGVDITQVGSEEREITALFADVRNFTKFSDGLEPDVLMTVINKYLAIASDAISVGKGIVDKFMGDAVTGLYNTQLNPQPDHARRAIESALLLIKDLEGMHEVLPKEERLFYGIGIHSGPAVLGNVGGRERKEFAALGEAPTICKYLQEQAYEKHIVISGETLALVADHFDVERITELKSPKPGYEHIECYRVIKARGPWSIMVEDLQDLLDDLFDDDELAELRAMAQDDD